MLALTVFGVAAVLTGLAVWLTLRSDPWTGLVAATGALLAAASAARAARRLVGPPRDRLGVFRDRLVIVNGRTEVQVPWREMVGATLADQTDRGRLDWPVIRLTDRLSVRLRSGGGFSFRPRTYGLEPVACLDLLLRLRDEPDRGLGLPAFDSVRDLSAPPVYRGRGVGGRLP